jgi:hypothetical protein
VVIRRPLRTPSPRAIRWDDDRGSLLFALLLAMIGLSVTALLVPMVLRQVSATQSYVDRNMALGAAQAGLEVAMAHMRAANDGAGGGELGELPCGPITGSVIPGGPRYSVQIKYYSFDPRTLTDPWNPPVGIACASSGVQRTPAYAYMISDGYDQASDLQSRRKLKGTYTFQTSNANIPGGLIHVYNGNPDLCFDAGSTLPAAGTLLQLQPCNAQSIQQMFAYNTDLTIVLISSRTATNPLGMCLDAGNPQAATNSVRFQPCAVQASPPAAHPTVPWQRWSLNDGSNLQGTTDGSTLNSFYFRIQSPNTAGSFVNLVSGTGGAGRFSPEAPAGAGASGTTSGQLVNFKQFGRCLDVTEFDILYGYLINWPCKQAPDPAQVGWNQRWTLPAVPAGSPSASGRIVTSVYCLRSPGSTAAGQYVTVVLCPVIGSTPTNMTWTVYEKTTTYATSYRVVDGFGNCLQPTDPTATPADLYPNGTQVSKIVVRACDGSTLQKWNAPANILDSMPLKDLGEQ